MYLSAVVKQQVLIPPSEPTPTHALPLSALDSQLFVRFNFKFMFVYKPGHEVDRATITDNFKSGLGRALIPYYPLAGRIRHRADGSGLEVDCRAQGVLFIEAVSDSTASSEFDKAPKFTEQWKDLLALHAEDTLKGDPVLVLQLTWLSDGGATLAVGLNHCMSDGTGIGEFLNSLADLAQGKRTLDELKPQPIWSRHLLDPRPFDPSRDYSLSHPEFGSLEDVSDGYLSSGYAREEFVPIFVSFDRNKINELKKLAGSTPTAFDVVAALVWRSWARSLNLPSNQKVKLIFSMSIRQRVEPRIPSGYYGNGFILAYAEASVGDLNEKGAAYAVELVMKAKARVGEEHVREIIDAVSWNRANVDKVGALLMTSWSRLGFEDVDFGLGKAVNVVPPCPNNICKLLPLPTMGNAIRASLAVPSGSVDKYLQFMENIYA